MVVVYLLYYFGRFMRLLTRSLLVAVHATEDDANETLCLRPHLGVYCIMLYATVV
jgi:hypothetical protein